ncbi:MAG: hypothetical protein DRQ44_15420 [Gammaproteobacteria bacterium]|nr:MAG: hypothetical protein DRQ44_15420 [Gammaproteobacteria bacterium]
MSKVRDQSDVQPDLGRRGLLTGAFLTREGRENVKRSQNPLGPRPPWHQQVMESCSNCDQECVASCSQKIIRLHQDEHAHAGTPWLDFSVAGCTFCGDCAEACPSLESYDRESAQIGNLQVAEASCLTWNDVFCMSCIGKCDVRALHLDERRRLLLNDSLCTGCGMCIHSCPVDAIKVLSYKL